MDITKALDFLHTSLQFGGLRACRINRKDGKVYISHLLECYIICTWLASIGVLVYSFLFERDFLLEDSAFGETVDFLQVTGVRMAHFVIITETLRNRHHFKDFIKHVREIDRIFMCWLNVDVDNGALRRHLIKRGLITISLYICVEISITIAQIFADQNFLSIAFFAYVAPFIIVGLRYFQIFAVLLIIRQRLANLVLTLNELNLSKRKRKENVVYPLTFVHAEYAQLRGNFLKNSDLKRLHIIRDLYNRLWELKSMLNECLGCSICANVTNDFISITSDCFWIFFNFHKHTSITERILQTATGILLCTPHIYSLLTLALLCEEILQKATELALGLHRIESDIDNDNHNTAIEQFSLELLHQKMNVSAAGFFDVNSTILYTIAGATTTYLIILIQFHLSREIATTNCIK